MTTLYRSLASTMLAKIGGCVPDQRAKLAKVITQSMNTLGRTHEYRKLIIANSAELRKFFIRPARSSRVAGKYAILGRGFYSLSH